MNIGEIPIPSGWKVLLVKAVLVLFVFVGCWWGWKNHQQEKERVSVLIQRQAAIEQRQEALKAAVEESKKRTERRLEAVAIQAHEYASGSDLSVLIDDLNTELEEWRRDQIRSGN